MWTDHEAKNASTTSACGQGFKTSLDINAVTCLTCLKVHQAHETRHGR